MCVGHYHNNDKARMCNFLGQYVLIADAVYSRSDLVRSLTFYNGACKLFNRNIDEHLEDHQSN